MRKATKELVEVAFPAIVNPRRDENKLSARIAGLLRTLYRGKISESTIGGRIVPKLKERIPLVISENKEFFYRNKRVLVDALMELVDNKNEELNESNAIQVLQKAGFTVPLAVPGTGGASNLLQVLKNARNQIQNLEEPSSIDNKRPSLNPAA